MWKLKLKVCLINVLAYGLCVFLLCLCFRGRLPRRPAGETVILVSPPDTLGCDLPKDRLFNEKK